MSHDFRDDGFIWDCVPKFLTKKVKTKLIYLITI